MNKPYVKRLLALVLAALLLAPLASLAAQAKASAKLNIALISDTHYFPESMAGGYGEVFDQGQIIGHPIEQTPAVLRSALAALKKRALAGEIEYLLIPGDLTREGELGAHKGLAKILADFERDAGIPLLVIPGNHDIDNGSAADFTSGQKEKAPSITAEEFFNTYKQFGYDLPNMERYTTNYGIEGNLSYAADLKPGYRLVALDTRVRRVSPELRAWAVKQCEKAVKNGQTVVAMGHHNLNDQFKGQLRVMQNQGIENMREVSEQFADAGMHFYFSGHLHMSEISPWYSDKGEVLYDIIVPGLYSFPGDFRVVNFVTEGKKITADVKSFPVDEVLRVRTDNGQGVVKDYTQPYYPDNLAVSFGYNGQGLTGFIKGAARRELGKALGDLQKNGGITALIKKNADLGPLNLLFEYLDRQLGKNTQRILGVIDNLVDEAFALPVSKLPCTRFIDELGFGNPKKPGTLEDAGNSILTYMFWKNHDPKEDAFVQDVLRRMRNGELVGQVLDFAIPKVLEVLGAEILPLLANVDLELLNQAMQCGMGTLSYPLLFLLALIIGPNMRDTISATLYDFASGAAASQSPSGFGTYAKLVYAGPVDAPTGPDTFRLPHDLKVTLSLDKKSAEITWYTKASLTHPEVKLTGGEARVAITSEEEEITAGLLDLGITQMMGFHMQAMKHTAKIEGLQFGKEYRFTAGDSEAGFRAGEKRLAPTETPVRDFLVDASHWFVGMGKMAGISWENRWYRWR